MTEIPESVATLMREGFARDDAEALRRASMTLHRWHELECGDGDEWKSWCLVRGRREGKAFVYDDAGAPYLEQHYHRSEGGPVYSGIGDRERGAQKRIKAILARYPGFMAYIQGDPRGCALYVMRPGDVGEGMDVSSCYTRGIAVYK